MAFNTYRRIVLTNAPYWQSRVQFSSSTLRFQDPFLMPNTPEHEAKTRLPDNISAPAPIPRANESVETMRARLVYQSRKRGTLETDLLLSTFAQEYLKSMSEAELRQYDKLLDESDWDIYYWATQRRPAPERWVISDILKRLQQHARNEGKAIRRMPDLS